MFRIALASVSLLMSTPLYAGTSQCDCPSISAKGTGDTSCSATESGGSCTIDFNTFNPADEQAAFELLSTVSPASPTWKLLDLGGGLTPERAFSDLSEEELIDTLVIYILVSTVQTETGLGDAPIGRIHEELRMQQSTVISAFAGEGPASISAGDGEVYITQGCIEVSVPWAGYWGMFKAYWSEAAAAPQCGR